MVLLLYVIKGGLGSGVIGELLSHLPPRAPPLTRLWCLRVKDLALCLGCSSEKWVPEPSPLVLWLSHMSKPLKMWLASWHLPLMCLVNQMQRPASTCSSTQGLLWEVPLEKPQTKGLSQEWIYLPIGPGFLISLLYLAHSTSVLGKWYTHFRWWVFPAETTEQPPFRTWTYTVLLTVPRCWLSPLRCCYGPGDGQLAGSTSLVL